MKLFFVPQTIREFKFKFCKNVKFENIGLGYLKFILAFLKSKIPEQFYRISFPLENLSLAFPY